MTAITSADAAWPGVLQVVLSLDPGGTERLVIDMCRRLRGRFRVAVCCLDAPGAWAGQLTSDGVDVVALHRRSGFHPSLGSAIRRVARHYRAGILHCHQYSPFVYGRLAALGANDLRLVFTEHGRYSDGPPSSKRKLVNPLLSRLPGQLYAVSENLKQHLLVEGFPGHRLGVVYNGIDPGARIDDRRADARRELGASQETVLFGTVARLDAVKDLVTMINAFVAVKAAMPSARLVIVGDGPERARLASHIREIGLDDAVQLAGHRDDARRLLAALDVYVNSSIIEGLSVTILEAMAASLPVVATDVGGTGEIVVNGETGRLVPSRAPVALTAAMLEAAGFPARKKWGLAGRARVEERFSIDRMVDDYTRAYLRDEVA
jgi:glycosyltransferase involved in cell wall biosynthesis